MVSGMYQQCKGTFLHLGMLLARAECTKCRDLQEEAMSTCWNPPEGNINNFTFLPDPDMPPMALGLGRLGK